MSYQFDYETKVWGTVIPEISPFCLAGLRFFYFIPHLKNRIGKLLEIGCGAGGNLLGIQRYSPELELYGVDIGRAAIRYGSEHFPQLHLVEGPAESLPYNSSVFSVVCFFDVLEHVVDPATCIKESVRVLDNGGLFHAYVPCEGEIFSLHGLLNAVGVNLKEKTAGHIQKLTRNAVEIMCQDAGLRIIEVRWSCHLLNQIGDLFYYLLLSLSGKKIENSLEGSLDAEGSRSGVFVLRWIKNSISWIWFWESRLFWFLPGAGIHITAIKEIVYEDSARS